MLSRLDDPARNPSNRRPLTDTQLSELPTHTYRPSKGASSPAQQEAFSSSHDPPSLSASSSTQGTLLLSVSRALLCRVVLLAQDMRKILLATTQACATVVHCQFSHFESLLTHSVSRINRAIAIPNLMQILQESVMVYVLPSHLHASSKFN